MATRYGRIGDTSMSNSEHYDMDANDYQADINGLENTEPSHQAGLRDLSHEIEQLWQTIEANDRMAEFPVAFLLHTFTETQRKWSTTEQGAYGVYYAITK